IFFMDFGGENVGRIDARSGKLSLYATPTPRSRPRRGRMDEEDRVWFAEWRAERIGMFDTRTEKFSEWPLPVQYFAPYDVVRDKTGKVWTAGMNSDRVLRLDLEIGHRDCACRLDARRLGAGSPERAPASRHAALQPVLPRLPHQAAADQRAIRAAALARGGRRQRRRDARLHLERHGEDAGLSLPLQAGRDRCDRRLPQNHSQPRLARRAHAPDAAVAAR